MVLHLFRSPHVRVDHSADISLVAGPEEPFHRGIVGIDRYFAGFTQNLGPLVQGPSLFRIYPGFGDVEFVEFGTDTAVGDRGLPECPPSTQR